MDHLLNWTIFAIGLFHTLTAIWLFKQRQYKWAWTITLADIGFLYSYIIFHSYPSVGALCFLILGMVAGIWVPGMYWGMKIEKAYRKDGSAN